MIKYWLLIMKAPSTALQLLHRPGGRRQKHRRRGGERLTLNEEASLLN